MSFNGNGTFQPYVPGNPVVTGTVISSTAFNATINDIAAGLSNAVTRDGQSPLTANLPAAGRKITGLGAGVVAGDSLRFEQLFSQGAEQDIASAATTDIGALNSTIAQITGTTTITSFGTNYNGPRFVRFAGALTLTHNATTLILPGGANITTDAGDVAILAPTGNPASGWRVVSFVRASGSVLVTSPTATLGFGTGAGGTVTQATSKVTTVTLNRPTGVITMNNAALAPGATAPFTLANSLFALTDILVAAPTFPSGASNYRVETVSAFGSPQIRVTNISGGSLSDALVINFAIIKGVAS